MTPGYRLRVWTEKDGLPDNRILSLLQTRDGYLWVGTRSGLSRFDGHSFRNFTHINVPRMANEACRALAEDTAGNLWIGTRKGLLCKRGHKFTCYTTKDGLADPMIWSLCPSRRGGVWVGTSLGLDCFHGGGFSLMSKDPTAILSIHENRDGTLWWGESSALRYLDPKTGLIKVYNLPKQWLGAEIQGIAPGNETQPLVLVHFRRKKFRLFQLDDHHFVPFTKARNPNGGRKMFLCRTKDGDLWMPSESANLYRFHDGKLIPFHIPWSNGKDFALCMIQDHEGNLWIGSENSGLYQLEPESFHRYTKAEGLAGNDVLSVLQSVDGSVWVGTRHGLSRLKDGHFTDYTTDTGLADDLVLALASGDGGTLWIGTHNGLDAYRNGQFTYHRFQEPFDPSDPSGFGWNKIRAILNGRDGSIWVAVPRGLFRLRKGASKFQRVTDGFRGASAPDALADGRVLLQTASGALWVGTAGRGIEILQGHHLSSLTRSNGLSSDYVYALHQDRDGVIWIGTDHGLDRYDRGAIADFTRAQGLFDDHIENFLEDNFGWLWIGSDKGIFRVRRQALDNVAHGKASSVQSFPFDRSDGYPGGEINAEVNQPSAFKTRDGRLWFCTDQGAVVVNPRKLRFASPPPPVVIEQVQSNGKIVYGDGLRSGAAPKQTSSKVRLARRPSGTAGATSRLILQPGQGRVLEFHYNANTFQDPEAARYKYRLEGYQTHWYDAGRRRVAFYTNLSPGHYCFQVIACNHHGVWTPAAASLALYLAPFYYQTWWFRFGAGLCAALFTYGIYKWRLEEVRRMNSLEKELLQANVRNRIARDLHDGLGAGLTQLRLIAALAARDQTAPSTLKDHLHHIGGLAQEVTRTLNDIIWIAEPRTDTSASLLDRICSQAEQLLQAQGVRCHFHVTKGFEATLGSNAVQNIYFVAKEALNNIARHSGATEVWVSAACSDGQFRLSLADNGRGFQCSSGIPTGHVRPDGGGHGLPNMRYRIEAIGGELHFLSGPGNGTKIEIRVSIIRNTPRGKRRRSVLNRRRSPVQRNSNGGNHP